MIKDSKLIGTTVPYPFGWKKFKVCDLFELKNTLAYTKNSDSSIISRSKNATTPFITTQVSNNGISGFSELEPLNRGNRITYSDTTTGDAIFYQEEPYIGRSHVCYLEPKFLNFNKRVAVFVIALIKKHTSGQFSYGTKLNKQAMSAITFVLPVTKDGQPDYDWIESYVTELEKSYVTELEKSYVTELENYLTVSNLSDTTLTPDEENVLALWRAHEQSHEGALTRQFRVGDLFEIISTRALNYDLLQRNGHHPYVVRSTKDNGIRDYVDYDKTFLNKGNVITLGIDTASYFYQEFDFFAGVNVKSLSLKSRVMNKEIALFLISVLQKQAGGYGYAGGKSFNTSSFSKLSLDLPVNSLNQPDYQFMETFITAQEKLAIKRLSTFRKEQIEMTKAII